MLGVVWKTVLVLIACLVAADLVGVAAGFVIDVLPLRGRSAALFYVIWFVVGVFCGLFAFNMAGAWATPKGGESDWSGQAGARRVGTAIVAISLLVLAALWLLFDRLYWSRGVVGDVYVPDSESHTITFFAAVLGGMVLARFVLLPVPDKGQS